MVYVISAARKSSKQKSPLISPLRASGVAHAKPVALKTQEVFVAGEKEDSSYVLRKHSRSRAKKILHRSCLRQSILRSEILRKKY